MAKTRTRPPAARGPMPILLDVQWFEVGPLRPRSVPDRFLHLSAGQRQPNDTLGSYPKTLLRAEMRKGAPGPDPVLCAMICDACTCRLRYALPCERLAPAMATTRGPSSATPATRRENEVTFYFAPSNRSTAGPRPAVTFARNG